jgi:hypothetical protein
VWSTAIGNKHEHINRTEASSGASCSASSSSDSGLKASTVVLCTSYICVSRGLSMLPTRNWQSAAGTVTVAATWAGEGVSSLWTLSHGGALHYWTLNASHWFVSRALRAFYFAPLHCECRGLAMSRSLCSLLSRIGKTPKKAALVLLRLSTSLTLKALAPLRHFLRWRELSSGI